MIELKDNKKVNARDLHEALGITQDFSNWIKYNMNRFMINVDDDIRVQVIKQESTGGRPKLDYLIDKEIASILIYGSQSKNISKALEMIGSDIKHKHTYSRFEESFVALLKEALDYIGIKFYTQHHVLGYRVDVYLPWFNIVVEYDEKHHLYNVESDKNREEEITNALGCEFIRLDYTQSNLLNVLKVLERLKCFDKDRLDGSYLISKLEEIGDSINGDENAFDKFMETMEKLDPNIDKRYLLKFMSKSVV